MSTDQPPPRIRATSLISIFVILVPALIFLSVSIKHRHGGRGFCSKPPKQDLDYATPYAVNDRVPTISIAGADSDTSTADAVSIDPADAKAKATTRAAGEIDAVSDQGQSLKVFDLSWAVTLAHAKSPLMLSSLDDVYPKPSSRDPALPYLEARWLLQHDTEQIPGNTTKYAFTLPVGAQEAAARQLALWRIVDDLAPGRQRSNNTDIENRAEALVSYADAQIPNLPVRAAKMQAVDSAVGVMKTLAPQHVSGHAVIWGRIADYPGGTNNYFQTTYLRDQTVSAVYPGAQVFTTTNGTGTFCFDLSLVNQSSLTPVELRWQQTLAPGSLFFGSDVRLVNSWKGAMADPDTVPSRQPVVLISDSPVRVIREATVIVGGDGANDGS